MESGIDNPDRTGMWDQRRLRTRLECRQCGVICERVVSPWRCLKSRHGCIYAYEQGETTYFGCLHKVFAPELDLEAFGEGRSGGGARSDPYGPIRATRSPRPQCPVSIERAYDCQRVGMDCVNPSFFGGARGLPGGRVIVTGESCLDQELEPQG
jgi:hypothetical protein